MGFRKASGMKPTQLRNPVPGTDESAFNQQLIGESLDVQPQRSPAASQPQQPMPEPTPTPAPSVSPEQSIAMPDDLDQPISLPDDLDEPIVLGSEEPIDYFTKYDKEKEVQTKFAGMSLKRTEDGKVLVKGPFAKEFKEPDETVKSGLRMLYQSYLDLPTIAGSVAGPAAVGAMYGAAGGPPGALAGTIAGALAGAAGGGLGAAASRSRFEEIKNDPEKAKDLYIMSKLFEGEDISPVGEAAATAFGAAGELVAGGITAAKASQSAMKQAAKLELEAMDPLLSKAIKDAELAGVELDAADVLRMVSPKVGEKVSTAASGGFGEELQKEVISRSQRKQVQLKASMDSLMKKHGGDIDFSNPEAVSLSSRFEGKEVVDPFTKQVMKPKKNKNVLEALEESMGYEISRDRAAVQEIAGGLKVDANQLQTSVTDMASSYLPGASQFIKNGKIDKAGFLNYVRTEVPVEGADKIAKALNMLDSITSVPAGALDSTVINVEKQVLDEMEAFKALGVSSAKKPMEELAASTNLGIKPAGARTSGMDFKTLTAFNDLVQGMVKDAEGTGIEGFVKQLAKTTRQFEDDAITKIAEMRGQPQLAEQVIARKAKYANAIDDITAWQKYIKDNDSLSGQFLKMNQEESKRFMSLLTPKQQKEMRGIVLDRAMRDSIDDLLDAGQVVKVSPSKLAKNLVKNPQAKANLEILYGKQDVKKIEAITNIADMLDRESLRSNPPSGLIDKMAKTISEVPGLSGAKDWLGALLMGNPRAKELVMTRARDMSRLLDRSGKGAVAAIAENTGRPSDISNLIKTAPTTYSGYRNNQQE